MGVLLGFWNFKFWNGWELQNSKPGTFQSTGFGSPGDWIKPDLNDPVDYIGVPVAWIK